MLETIRHALTQLGVFTAHPTAFLIVALYTVLWVIFQPRTFDWHAVATLATWFMTLLIQRAEHRDTQAIHAKLDEILRAFGRADNRLANIDELQPEEIEERRDQARSKS